MLASRITGIAAVVLSLALFLWAQNGPALAFLLFNVLTIAILFCFVRIAAAITRIDIEVAPSYQIGSPCPLGVRLLRGLPVCPGALLLDVNVRNTAFQSTRTYQLHAALNSRRPLYEAQIIGEEYGLVRITVSNVRIADPLRLFSARIPFSADYETMVFPERLKTEASIMQTPRARPLGDHFDDSKSGRDVGEIFDIRDYVPGDSVSAIHWKLSSKLETLMVREFSHPADHDVAVIACGCLQHDGNELSHAEANGVAAMTLSISEALVRAGMLHDAGMALEHKMSYSLVDDMASQGALAESLLVTPIVKTSWEMSKILMGAALGERFTKVTLVTNYYDEALWSHLAQDIDLSVIVVVSQSTALVNQGRYSLIAMNAKELDEHVHHIVL